MAKAALNLRYHTAALIACFALAIAAGASPSRGAESVNGIAAIVNDKVITYSEVREVCEPRERLFRSQYSGDELVKKITELRKNARANTERESGGDQGQTASVKETVSIIHVFHFPRLSLKRKQIYRSSMFSRRYPNQLHPLPEFVV